MKIENVFEDDYEYVTVKKPAFRTEDGFTFKTYKEAQAHVDKKIRMKNIEEKYYFKDIMLNENLHYRIIKIKEVNKDVIKDLSFYFEKEYYYIKDKVKESGIYLQRYNVFADFKLEFINDVYNQMEKELKIIESIIKEN